MPRRNVMSLAATTAALAVPAGAAIADAGAASRTATPPTIDVALPGPHDTVRAKLNAAVRPPLVDDVVRLARAKARLRDRRLRDGYRDAVATWSPRRLRAERRDLGAELRRLRAERRSATPAGGGSTASAGLEAIAACESGGDPGAVDASGTYRGKYQFDMQTWQSVGGTGDPAAAPEAEQDRRAAILYARAGSSPWPACSG